MPRAATSGYANRRTRRRLLDYTPLSRGSCYVAEVSVASYSHPALWIAANTAYIDSGHISTRDSGSLKGAAVDSGLTAYQVDSEDRNGQCPGVARPDFSISLKPFRERFGDEAACHPYLARHGVGNQHLQTIRFNRRHTPMAAFQTLLSWATVHGPTTYKMLYGSESTR